MHGRADLSTAPIHTEKALEDGAEPNLFHSPRLLQARYRECLHANRREVTFNAKYFVECRSCNNTNRNVLLLTTSDRN
jgi:hypothetical protein